MKFSVAKEHRDFFQKHQAIEFEGLLPPEQVLRFNQAVDEALVQRLGITADKIRHQPPQKLFLDGRDLWRTNPLLKKMVMHLSCAEIASELIEHKPLRLGYAQLFPQISPLLFKTHHNNDYALFLQQQISLEACSCLQGVLCGLMLCLTGDGEDETGKPSEGIDIFAKKAGSGIFFHPDLPISFQNLQQHPNQRYLLIVYTHRNTVYRLQPADPQTHALKHCGYVFGDRLTDKLNPIVGPR